ncbi:hypothetical protein SKAU_G00087660 [Synaphobranchus kaupii]|uniref:PiggyBac transposable element-derived protein domain-containing protein n=1 Tax=Synaphobranchus kaupii TaxID=118154 RepID=A0A9Q1FVV6_SYNKA|nr:hypothetical protein SKAU_G00087660 [Synaphobranchus kaupii]
MFFTEELVGDIVEETNLYASELQEKIEPGAMGKLAKWVATSGDNAGSSSGEEPHPLCGQLVQQPHTFPQPADQQHWGFRPNRKCMPIFSGRKMQRGDLEFMESRSQLAVKWHDKGDVHVLSAVHTASMAPTGKINHLTGERKIKPECIAEYNKKMGAVEKDDMINSLVECVYRGNVMRQLLEEHHTPRHPPTGGHPAADNPLRLTARHFMSAVPQMEAQGSRTQRHCHPGRGNRSGPLSSCVHPATHPCALCFEEYHTLKHY